MEGKCGGLVLWDKFLELETWHIYMYGEGVLNFFD